MRGFEMRESMVPRMEIGAASRQDVPQIVKLEKAAAMKAYANPDLGITARDIEASYTGGGQIWLEDIMDIEKGDKNKNIWVAKQDGSVIGVCIARKGKQFSVDGLYVSPQVQRSGAGTELMGKAIEWAGPDQDVNLDVVNYNEQAINFYKKLGFEEHPEIKTKHPLVNGKSMNMIRMVRSAYKKAA